MKRIFPMFIATLIMSVFATADEKRWYTMTVSKPKITESLRRRTVTWTITTNTRFDREVSESVRLDARKYLSRVTKVSKPKEISTWFRHSDRKTSGDPKRFIDRSYHWRVRVYGQEEVKKLGVVVGHKEIVMIERLAVTSENLAPEDFEESLWETVRDEYGEGNAPYRTESKLLQGRKKGVVVYRERVDGFSSLWHFNNGSFVTEVSVTGVPKL